MMSRRDAQVAFLAASLNQAVPLLTILEWGGVIVRRLLRLAVAAGDLNSLLTSGAGYTFFRTSSYHVVDCSGKNTPSYRTTEKAELRHLEGGTYALEQTP